MKRLYILFGVIVSVLAISTTSFAEHTIRTERGIEYEDLIVGDGMRAVPGKIATIHFVMWADNNGVKGDQLYDSHKDSENPLSFKIGTKKIADGLNIGVNGMKIGGKRRLHVPSELNPKIASDPFPANANLIFEVELLDVK
jgi:FKBP-type peptidyl-prolyl cis-trans isomerase FkpA